LGHANPSGFPVASMEGTRLVKAARGARKGGAPMAEKKEKATKKSRKTMKPAGGKKDELSEKNLHKASGAILINEK
jgi:hypothetical protein